MERFLLYTQTFDPKICGVKGWCEIFTVSLKSSKPGCFFSLEKEVTFTFLSYDVSSWQFIIIDPRNGVVFHAVMNWKHRQDARANIHNDFLRTSVQTQSIPAGYLSILALWLIIQV